MSNEILPANLLPAILAPLEVGESAAQVINVSPFVSFVSQRSQLYTRLAPVFENLQEGEPVLVRAEPDQPIRLNPFRFIPIHHFAHYAEVEEDGTIVRVTLDAEHARQDKSLREHVEAVVLVFVDDQLVPARVTFRTTKARAGWTAVKAIDAAKSPDWPKISPDHKATLVVPDPRFRFSVTVKMQYGMVSRSSGFKFSAATGIVKPTTAADWKLIADSFRNDAFNASCQLAVDQWMERIEELKSHIEG